MTEKAPKRIWATYDDALGINWQDGKFTNLEQPQNGRYTEYVRADILAESQAENVRLREALNNARTCLEEVHRYTMPMAIDGYDEAIHILGASKQAFTKARVALEGE